MLAALEGSDPRWLGADPRAARDRLLRETFARNAPGECTQCDGVELDRGNLQWEVDQ